MERSRAECRKGREHSLAHYKRDSHVRYGSVPRFQRPPRRPLSESLPVAVFIGNEADALSSSNGDTPPIACAVGYSSPPAQPQPRWHEHWGQAAT
eukprot:350631-Chlamydomonas_euryale.AAC.13